MKHLAFLALLAALAGRLSATPLVIIDPGHGGTDPGVQADGLTEADACLEIATQLQTDLKGLGIEAVLTRTDNSAMLLSQRAATANVSGAKAFISLHLNHSASPYAHGAKIFIPKAGPAAASGDPLHWDSAASAGADQARALGAELARSLSASESQKASVQSLNMGIFKGLGIPGVVVEMGYLSHAETLQRFKDPEYRKAVASKLASGIQNWAGVAAPAAAPAPAAAGAAPAVTP